MSLKDRRIELIEEYYYWLSRPDCDDEVLEDIENEIYDIELRISNGEI